MWKKSDWHNMGHKTLWWLKRMRADWIKNINQELTCVVFKAGHEFVESPSHLSSLYRNKMANFTLEDKTAWMWEC